jgi:Mg-chelatase subunit ChlD
MEDRKGADLVLVIDRSGSMQQQIEAQDSSNKAIETGITCLVH